MTRCPPTGICARRYTPTRRPASHTVRRAPSTGAFFLFVYLSYYTTHTTQAEHRAQESPGRQIQQVPFFSFSFNYLLCHTTHTTRAERRAETQRQRRSASSGQNTRRGIEGEDPAAAGIERFFSLKGPR